MLNSDINVTERTLLSEAERYIELAQTILDEEENLLKVNGRVVPMRCRTVSSCLNDAEILYKAARVLAPRFNLYVEYYERIEKLRKKVDSLLDSAMSKQR